jgi:hypothetical protein
VDHCGLFAAICRNPETVSQLPVNLLLSQRSLAFSANNCFRFRLQTMPWTTAVPIAQGGVPQQGQIAG